ncbi:MAG: aminotransferase class V-fold PLP-dependent enzyme [Cyclobacteriaceae bacterium]
MLNNKLAALHISLIMELDEILFELGEDNEAYFGAATPPLIQSNNFLYKSVEAMRHALNHEDEVPFYTRGSNPTTDILRKKMAALEKTEDSLIFSSGSAAISAAVINQVSSGDHVVCIQKPYSWTAKLLSNLLPKFGVSHTFVEGSIKSFDDAIKPNTSLVILESPNSWTFEMQDIAPIVEIARKHNITTIMDNSYATPLNFNPADFDVDLIAHSSSKYIGGHSDAVSGILCGSKKMIRSIFQSEFMTLGGTISPFNSWLLLRGLRTLPIRMNRVAESTPVIVDYLENHPKIKAVHYPHSKNHPQYELALKYLKNPLGQFTLEINTESMKKVEQFCNKLKKFRLGCSWGGYESLAFPAITLYDSLNYSTATTPFTMVRMYVGLENPQHLIKDLALALDDV